MKNYLVLLSFIFLLSNFSSAQKNTLIELGNKKISIDEFERIYQKNNSQLSDQSEVKTPSEYLDMFVDFKLKVIEAESRGLDTMKSFVEELAGYREELARPYLTDISYTDSMIKTAYFRTVNEVNASHILIMADENVSPEDTLVAYNKILDIRNQFLAGQKSFEELATLYSEDPSAQSNGGSLGYFRAFQMVTPFENAAFNTKPGEVSMPMRTRFGYHLVYTKDVRPVKPDIRVAHIMKMFANPQAASEEEVTRLKLSIDSVYQLVLKGEDFGMLAQKYSDDRRSASNNGEMNWIGSSFGVPEFTSAAYALEKDGDVSGVVKTSYGWHIIKRLEMRAVPTFESLEEQLTNQVKSDPQRSASSKTIFVNKLKKQYGFTDNKANMEQLAHYITSELNDSLTRYLPSAIMDMDLFTFAGKKFTVSDFVGNLFNTYTEQEKLAIPSIVKKINEFEEKAITDYEDRMLESKYPDFAALMQEYHDGILLFTIMEQEVWNKAMTDTAGLEIFYAKNPSLFSYGEHFEGMIIECNSKETKEKVESILTYGETNPENIKMQISSDSVSSVTINKGRWEKGDNAIVNYLTWNGEKPEGFDENLVVLHGEIKQSAVKKLDEARGLYVSEYQDHLEKQWIKELREKFPIKVNKKLLKKVKPINQ